MEEKTSVNKTSKNDHDSIINVFDLVKIMFAFIILAVLHPRCTNLPSKLGFESDNWVFIWCIIAAIVLGSVSGYLKSKKKKIKEKRQEEAKNKIHN